MKDVLSAIGGVLVAFFFLRAWVDIGFNAITGLWLGVIASIAFGFQTTMRREWRHWRRVSVAFFLAGIVGGLAILCAVPKVPPAT